MRRALPKTDPTRSKPSKKTKHSTTGLPQQEVRLISSNSPPNQLQHSKMLANRNKSKTEIGQSQSTIKLPDWLPPNPLNPDLFSTETINSLKQQYNNSKPYHHVQFPKLLIKEAMSKIQSEVIHYLPTSARETDLFKVNQSLDLNNIDLTSSLAQKLPNLLSLRTYLYSHEFRQLLQQVTGCQEIVDTVDCAANVYSGSHGNHLLTHDDVITTRVLSYIIYLPLIDPAEAESSLFNKNNSLFNKDDTNEIKFDFDNNTQWNHSMGGHLELFDKVSADILPFGVYPSAQQHIRDEHHNHDVNVANEFLAPANQGNNDHPNVDMGQLRFLIPPRNINIPFSTPSKLISPNFNSMVVFEVKPQASYHAVQEVYSFNSKRISIQGWFHQHVRQPDYGATLRMLQIPTATPTTAQIPLSSDQPPLNHPSDNSRNILQLIVDNRTHELTPEEVKLATLEMFPSRQFELFKTVNDAILQSSFDKLSLQNESDTDDNLNETEIDYLTKVVLLHVHDCMTKQANQAHPPSNQNPDFSSLSQPLQANAQQAALPTENNLSHSADVSDDVDLYDPQFIKQDLQFLRKFISPQYSSVTVLEQLQAQWESQPVVQLGNFLKPELIQLVIKSLIRSDVVDRIALVPDFTSMSDCPETASSGEGDHDEDMDFDFGVEDEDSEMDFDFGISEDDGKASAIDKPLSSQLLDSTPIVSNYNKKISPPSYLTGLNPLQLSPTCTLPTVGRWSLSGPAYLQRYAYFSTAPVDNDCSQSHAQVINWSTVLNHFNSCSIQQKSGLILESLVKFLFASVAFTRLIEWVTSYRLLAHRSTIRRFRTGLDYSVGNYNDMIECSNHDVLMKELESANEYLIKESIALQDRDLALQRTVAVDMSTIQPNTLAILDITLSFCDNGQFDHIYGKNIWNEPQDGWTDNELPSHNDKPAILLEASLYPNSQLDLMRSDISSKLPFIDQQLENKLTRSHEVKNQGLSPTTGQFSTLPACDVRFKQKQRRWESDDAGGFVAYIPVDETTEGDDAQQYVEGNDDDDLISLSLSNNTLTICRHKPNVLSFVRYVNFHAPGSRFDISMNCIYQKQQ